MKFLDPAEQVLFPAILSLRADTAQLLSEMAEELETSLDEVLSSIAEDAVSELPTSAIFFSDVVIPDRCSTEDLFHSIQQDL